MSEETNTATAPATNEATPAPTAPTAPTEPVVFELNEFREGPFKGFKFYAPEYNTVDKLREVFGDDAILALANSQVLARIRTKVKNDLPKDVKTSEIPAAQAAQLQKHPDGILFSAEQAAAWRPDVRDLSPNKLFKLAKEAFENGDVAKGQELLLKMAQALQS